MLLEKVSIVIPAYNSANSIARCLDSCLEQTYSNIEVIVVDDGSTDITCEILLKYAEVDNRFAFFSIANSGASIARNYGLNKSSGFYVLFLDSDDYLSPSCVRLLVDRAYKEGCEMSIGQSLIVNKDLEPITKSRYALKSGSAIESFLYGHLPYTMWPILFKRDVFNKNELCNSLSVGEDFFIMAQIFSKKLKVSVIDDTVYYHVKSPGSLTASMSYKKYADNYKSFTSAIEFVESYDSSSLVGKAVAYRRVKYFLSMLRLGSPFALDAACELKKNNCLFSKEGFSKSDILFLRFFSSFTYMIPVFTSSVRAMRKVKGFFPL